MPRGIPNVPRNPKALLMRKVRIDANGCWIWQASSNGRGYGYFRYAGGSSGSAHRCSYELFRGPSRYGHAYTEENTYVTPDGRRNCLTCRRTASRHAYMGKKMSVA